MTVKNIHTLGASPLVLLSKLATAGGITLNKTETVAESGGKEFINRIVAQIASGLYIEVKDTIYSLLGSNNAAPPKFAYDAHILAQEATESDKTKTFAAGTQTGIKLGDGVTSGLGNHSMSLLATMPVVAASNTFDESVTFKFFTSSKDGVSWATDSAKVVVTGELNSGESIVDHNGPILIGAARASSPDFPFMIINFPYNLLTGLYKGTSYDKVYLLQMYAERAIGYPLVISACDFRIAQSIDTSNELVNPTDWSDLPIFTDVTSDGASLIFHVDATRGQFLAISTMDTSKGNKMEGTFPVVYRNTPYFSNPNSVSEVACKVLGDASTPTAQYPMSEYVPAIPIANDNVSGGPVVTNVFAVGTNEIRGAVGGVLGCSENLAIGTIGWLNGLKYCVVRPGRMVKIG